MNSLSTFDLDAIAQGNYSFWQRMQKREVIMITERDELFNFCLNRHFTLHEIRDLYKVWKVDGYVEVEL